jgi:collagen type I/II/III/V/XI/XXIV/XXVII alpha
MATLSWSTITSGNWSVPSNWSTGALPAATDTAQITRTFGVHPYTITEDTTTKIAALTVGDSNATLAFNTADKTLTVSGSTILNLGTISITNATDTLSTGLFSQTGGTFTESAGKLDVTGLASLAGSTTDTISGGVFNAGALTIGDGSSVQRLTLSGGTTTVSGTTTINGATAVRGSQIVMSGGNLAATGGITFGTGTFAGTLSGAGTVTGGSISGAGTITATGTLDIANTILSGPTLTISTGVVSDLKLEGIVTSAAAITINDARQTLEIGAKGALTIGAAETVTGGGITLDGGTLTDANGISFGTTKDQSGRLSGFGTVAAILTRVGGGADTITASGGRLFLGGAIGAGSGLVYRIAGTTSSVLELDGGVGAGNSFTFLGAAGDLAYKNVNSISENILGLNVGTTVTPTNFIDYMKQTATVLDTSNAHTGTGATVHLSDGSVLTLSGITGAVGTWFVNTKTDGAGGTDIFLSTADMTCYAAGTRILTAIGERTVESLMQGDIVLTLAGEELSAQPVKWVGQRRIDRTAHPHAETAAPIRIRRGAFADNMPHRDLLVSPDHAIFVDGKLICARQLINGTTIRPEKGWTSVEYFHVELGAHAILLAEGLPAESYLNTGNRGFFANSGEPLVLHPDLTDETDYPTRAAGSCAPFVSDEAGVRPVWQRLAERAAALGQPAPTPHTTSDPDLRIVAKGRTVRPLYGENGLYIFALPKGATEVRLVSRAGSPTDARPWLDDRRCLGVNVERIVLRGASELREVPVDHPGLSQGWQAVERDGVALRRWTSGKAVLPLPALVGPTMLEIRAGSGGMAYVTGAEQERRAA